MVKKDVLILNKMTKRKTKRMVKRRNIRRKTNNVRLANKPRINQLNFKFNSLLFSLLLSKQLFNSNHNHRNNQLKIIIY